MTCGGLHGMMPPCDADPCTAGLPTASPPQKTRRALVALRHVQAGGGTLPARSCTQRPRGSQHKPTANGTSVGRQPWGTSRGAHVRWEVYGTRRTCVAHAACACYNLPRVLSLLPICHGLLNHHCCRNTARQGRLPGFLHFSAAIHWLRNAHTAAGSSPDGVGSHQRGDLWITQARNAGKCAELPMQW